MGEGSRCKSCPCFHEDDPVDPGKGLLCADLIEYPIWIIDGPVSVKVDRAEDLADGLSQFTRRYFAEVMKNPGVTLDPRGLLRITTSDDARGRRRLLCPFSFPVEPWAKLALEQVLMDTSGMQPRYLINDLSWLEQPAIYTDVVAVVQEARSVAQEYLDSQREEKKT